MNTLLTLDWETDHLDHDRHHHRLAKTHCRPLSNCCRIADHCDAPCLFSGASGLGQVELGPRAIGSQNLGGRAADCQGEAAAIAQRQPTSAGQGSHCPGQFGLGFGQRLDRDAGGGEQFTDPAAR